MNLILVTFGTSDNGLWNMKRFGFTTVAEAVEAGEESINSRPFSNEGFVVLASWYEDGKNMDEIKVVYEENTEGVNVVTFPHIGVYTKTVEEVA